jgi:hypothetical protein
MRLLLDLNLSLELSRCCSALTQFEADLTSGALLVFDERRSKATPAAARHPVIPLIQR